MEFDKGNDKSGEYKVEAIQDSAVYATKSKSGHLPGFYFLVLWKGYLKEKNTWEPASAIQQLRKLISSFYKDHPDKPTATSPAIDTAPPMARPTVKSTEPLKWKRGRLANSTNKRAKKNWAAFDFYRVFGQIQVSSTLDILSRTACDSTWRHVTFSWPSSKHLPFDFQVSYLNWLFRPCKPQSQGVDFSSQFLLG